MKAKLIIIDECNVKFEGLSTECRRKLVKSVEFFVPGSQYSASRRLGRWDGKKSFFNLSGRTYLNILDKLLLIIQNEGYELEIEDRRISNCNFEFTEVNENSYSHIVWPKGHPFEGEPIKLREHQVNIINGFLNNLIGVTVAATSSGKTIITSVLSHKIEKYGRSIIIVPTKDLVTQTEEDYINMGLDVGVFYGDRKEYNKKHTICTWQSLSSLSKKSKKADLDIDIHEFFKDVVCVMADECHRVTGEVLQDLLTIGLRNVPIRWGLTGTLPEEPINRMALLVCVGPVIGEVKAAELQEKGILAKLKINILQLQDLGDVFDSYQSELKWLTTNKKRLEIISQQIEEISKTGNTLILVDRIECGHMLESLIPNSIFISGETKSKNRKDEYKEMQISDDKILIASYGIASTGISINRIFNLVLFEPGKSFVRVIQSIGRGLRVAKDKDFVNVWDICSNSKYSKKHLTKRKAFYKEAEYEFSVKKVDY